MSRVRSTARPRPPTPSGSDLVVVDHPTGNAYNWLAHRQLNNALLLAAQDHARGRLLDIGCGTKPYAEMLRPFVDEHVGVDHPDSPHVLTSVDVVASAYDIPLPQESFDTVLMSEVLEHLEEPKAALTEAARLLKGGGMIILTTPFIWPLHEEPRDFFRYSPNGLRYLLGHAGFEDPKITPLSGQWSTLGLLSAYALRASPLRKLGRGRDALARAGQSLGAKLDQVSFKPWLSWNHIAVARKPTEEGPS